MQLHWITIKTPSKQNTLTTISPQSLHRLFCGQRWRTGAHYRRALAVCILPVIIMLAKINEQDLQKGSCLSWPLSSFCSSTKQSQSQISTDKDLTEMSEADMIICGRTYINTMYVRESETVRVGGILNPHRSEEELYALLTVNSCWFHQIANRETAINER